MTPHPDEQARDLLTDILMIAEAEMDCAMSVQSIVKIKIEFAQAIAKARLAEAEWFAAELDRRGLCVTDWHHERVRSLRQAAGERTK